MLSMRRRYPTTTYQSHTFLIPSPKNSLHIKFIMFFNFKKIQSQGLQQHQQV
ncbi:hypothetical protein AHAS_Ahas11G0166900 [Arachis hypogaea]